MPPTSRVRIVLLGHGQVMVTGGYHASLPLDSQGTIAGRIFSRREWNTFIRDVKTGTYDMPPWTSDGEKKETEEEEKADAGSQSTQGSTARGHAIEP